MGDVTRGELLAVDLGLKTGLALYGDDGRLRWYRSQNFGSTARLRRGAASLLRSLPNLTHVVLEGGGPIAEVWAKEAARRGLHAETVDAGTWRRTLLWARHRRTGAEAKAHADVLARKVIAWSGAARPTSLRHDAAEAILVGLWGVLRRGWLAEIPAEVRR